MKYLLMMLFLAIYLPASAGQVISRDVCNFDFGSSYKHVKGLRYEMTWAEQSELLDLTRESSGKQCLSNKRILTPSNTNRREPKTINCRELPRRYYSDKNGIVIYVINDLVWSGIEKRIADFPDVEHCIVGLIDDM